MVLSRAAYRARQFWDALVARPKPVQLDSVQERLTPRQFELFQGMHPSEMSHAICMCEDLIAKGENHPELLTAALLHDVGKARHPLRIWERVLIMLGQRVFPQQAARWGDGEPQGWRRAFIVAAQHPTWGAEMAAAVGASPLVMEMIRHHQGEAPDHFSEDEKELLAKLQAVDNG
jgi:putative nucleotidyltransferase with HDIG domain